jgi:hypothetical protein
LPIAANKRSDDSDWHSIRNDRNHLASQRTDKEKDFDVDMKLGPGEPSAGPWRVTPIGDVVQLVFDADRKRHDRPSIVAVDGRCGSGKSTLANLLHQSVPASGLVHTDDVAWHHSFFDWSDLLVENILKPLRNGKAVSYRPPGWQKHERPGAIEVAAGLDLVVVEGVGASRTEVMPLIDSSLWVQSDLHEGERRGIARDGGTGDARNFWHEWAPRSFNSSNGNDLGNEQQSS